MLMKNKLQKHHKSKMSVISKKLMIGTASVFGAIAIISLPTYISINLFQEIPLQAEENPSVKPDHQIMKSSEEFKTKIIGTNDISTPLSYK